MAIDIFRKVTIAFVVLLLMLGYLGVNLLDFSRESLLIIRIIGLAFLVLLIALNIGEIRSFEKSALIFGSFAGLGMVASSISMNLFYIFVYLIACKRIPILTQINVMVWILVAAVSLTFILIDIGYVHNQIDITAVQQGAYVDEYERARMTFGYKNVNAFSSLITSLCLLLFVSNYGKVVRLIFPVGIAVYFYLLTDSRTLMAVVAICFAVYFTLITYPNGKDTIRKGLVGIILAFVFVSMFAAPINTILPVVDELFNGRLHYIERYHAEINYFQWIVGGAEPSVNVSVDNAFALLMGALGVPVFVWLVLHIIKSINIYCDVHRAKEYAFSIGVLISAFGESSIVRPELMAGLVFWQLMLSKNNNLSS